MDHHHHSRLEISPLLVGLLGVMAGAVIVGIVHCLIVLWCNDPPRRRTSATPLPRSQRESLGLSASSSGTLSNVQLVIASNYSGECKDETCAVCLSEFNQGDEVRVLPGCAHTFHVPCIDKWLHFHRNCPLCRAETMPSSRDLVCSLPNPLPAPAPESGAL